MSCPKGFRLTITLLSECIALRKGLNYKEQRKIGGYVAGGIRRGNMIYEFNPKEQRFAGGNWDTE